MYNIIQNIIGYAGDWTNSYNGYIVQGCIALVVLSCVVSVDFIYKIFLGFIARKDK